MIDGDEHFNGDSIYFNIQNKILSLFRFTVLQSHHFALFDFLRGSSSFEAKVTEGLDGRVADCSGGGGAAAGGGVILNASFRSKQIVEQRTNLSRSSIGTLFVVAG